MELGLLQEKNINYSYNIIDDSKLHLLESKHQWLVNPLYTASDAVLDMPFFKWLDKIKSADDFAEAAKQLYYHSATFPKVLGLMLGLTSHQENSMMPFYAQHANGEADHHQLLALWMLRNGIIKQYQSLDEVMVTTETNACINLAYQLAMEQDREKWIVAINCGIERCSNDFFKRVASKMHELNIGDIYFDIHVEADEHHSVMGLQHIQSHAFDSARGRQLIAKALEAVSLWASMLHSWIGMDVHPKFGMDGKLISM